MLVTMPLPDEYSFGHMGRMLKLNAMPTDRVKAFALVRQVALERHLERATSPLESVAAIVGLNPVLYARQHSLLPFLSFGLRANRSGHHSKWRGEHFRIYGVSARGTAGLCPECVVEDEDSFGFSYWRREHQIEGMRWCERHDEPLRFLEHSDACLESPRKSLAQSRAHSKHSPLYGTSMALLRFQEIARLMLKHGAPVSLRDMRIGLVQHAQSLGFGQRDSASSAQPLSDRIFELFPRDWLLSEFPSSACKRPGTDCADLDIASSSWFGWTPSAKALAVGLVALFDEPEDALRAIRSGSPPNAQPRTRGANGATRVRLENLEATEASAPA